MGPRIEEAPVTPMVSRMGYPASRMALISTVPSPAASAAAVPDMPAKIMLATTLTWPRPPRRWPTSVLANPKIRSVMPVAFITLAARRKNEAESSAKLLRPSIMRWAKRSKERSPNPLAAMTTARAV